VLLDSDRSRALAAPRSSFAVEVAMEPVTACDLCGGSVFEAERTSRDLVERMVAGVHRLVRCAGCRLCFLDPRPRPDQIARLYPDDYAPHVGGSARRPARWQELAGSRGARPSALARLIVRIGQNMTFRPIPAWVGDGVILDVGCGGGAFLDTMKQLGWTTHGCDAVPAACEVASRKGHAVRLGNAEDLDYPDASFDVVYVNHVLEHTASPRRALAGMWRVLRPGGQLVLGVPNYGGLQMRTLGRYSTALDLPRHLYQFERRTIGRYLAEAGFHDVRLSTRTGSQSLTKAIRLLVNDALGTGFRREPAWLSAPFGPMCFFLGLFGYFGAGRDLRAVATRPAATPPPGPDGLPGGKPRARLDAGTHPR
jgi:2-polyprenyl-3-methyl-5-hydroxy-6-metoxy-1,4-benzoquinol methylase